MENYNCKKFISCDKATVVAERIKRGEENFLLIYRLILQKNNDSELSSAVMYDIQIIKRYTEKTAMTSGQGHREACATLSAVSSDYSRAKHMFDLMVKHTLTPMCAHEFVEEYYAIEANEGI